MQVRTCTILTGAVLAFLLTFGGLVYGESVKGQLNINTATIEELQLLPGIGQATAQNILDYREANGPFTSVEDIIKVKGVGDRKLEQLRHYLKTEGKSDFEPMEPPPLKNHCNPGNGLSLVQANFFLFDRKRAGARGTGLFHSLSESLTHG